MYAIRSYYGGPAGTAAAAWLARHGYDVALLEKGGADRDKVSYNFV